MKKNILMILVSASLIGALSGCLKKIELFNTNTTTVTFNSGPLFLTADKTVNPKDSIKFSYTITCPTKMKYIYLVKNSLTGAVSQDTIKPNANHFSFSAVKKLIADSIAGSYYYKVVARDSSGQYLGASDPIIVTVTPDFMYYTNKRVAVPDTTAKTNKTYFSLASQTSFSYSEITAANSGQIDFGYFWDPTLTGTAPNQVAKGHTIYNLNLSPMPSAAAIYDISTFTKNLTLFKLITTPTWVNINSAGILKSTGATTFKTPSAAFNTIPSLVAGNVILFKTVAGKYGAILITYVNQGSASRSTYMNFEVKMQN